MLYNLLKKYLNLLNFYNFYNYKKYFYKTYIKTNDNTLF